MGVVLGKNIFIYAGSSGTSPIIAAAKSCTISSNCDLIEKASSSQGTSKEFIPGRGEWEVSLDHLVTTGTTQNPVNPFDGLLKVRGTYTLSMVIEGTRKIGTAICQHADIRGSVGAIGTGNIKFKGSGPLTSPQ